MPYDLKSFLQIKEAVDRLEGVAQTIQQLVEDGPAGLTDARDELERIRREVEDVGARMIAKALAGR